MMKLRPRVYKDREWVGLKFTKMDDLQVLIDNPDIPVKISGGDTKLVTIGEFPQYVLSERTPFYLVMEYVDGLLAYYDVMDHDVFTDLYEIEIEMEETA